MGDFQALLGGAPIPAVAASFTGGLLVSLSPCVYPLVPIISAYVGARSGQTASRARAFFLSLSYVMGLALVYAGLGMLAALGGGFFGRVSSSPWSLLTVGSILVVLGLNLLDLLPLPRLWSNRPLTPAAGGMPGAFLLGAASGLVAGPCTSPVLFGLLTYVATNQTPIFGGLLLFSFAFGMGTLLLAVGTFAGLVAALPRPGGWMLITKKVLASILLAMAAYYLYGAGQLWLQGG